MLTRLPVATLLATGLTLASLAPVLAVPPAAPPATKYQTTLTTPTAGASPTTRITKSSMVMVKATGNNVTFQVKLKGVSDMSDLLVTNTNNSFQVDIIVNGFFSTQSFPFDLTLGKTDNMATKFTVTNSSLPTGPVAGEPIEVVSVRVTLNGESQPFGKAGITLK